MSTPTKVIISGAGIAGPVLAMFLKLKGYEPVVYERTEKISGLGLSLILQPNGLRVLSLIPGLVEKIVGKELESIRQCSIVPEDEGVLADSDAIPRISDDLGSCILATRRLLFNRTLVDTAESLGMKIVWGHQLVALKQADGSVEVAFANGATDTASFVVGCDGLHSNTRTCLLGQEQADFTGLTQTGGISPTPEVLSKRATLMNIYGDGVHMVSYPISDTHTSWAITVQESEAKETWRSMDEERQKEFKEGPISKWGFGAGELVSTADKIVKVNSPCWCATHERLMTE
ncbi:hypothetical protein AcW1_009265 [Taiwanofungus camphoratus]|nr:hypothetical protein AcW1_009265 [Antrodia cinnamomea]